MGIAILNHRVETVHHTQDRIFKLTLNIILDHNRLSITETEIAHDDRSHEKDFVMLGISLLYQEQSDNTTLNTENTDTPKVSEETLLEQQFNDLRLELNQDTQDEYFNCQEKCNTLTEEYIFSTSCKNNIWVLPLTIDTQQTPDHKKTISPPQLDIYYLLDSGARLNILNTDNWNEIKEYHKLQLKATTLVLSAANSSKLQSSGTIKLTLYPDVTESRTLKNTSYTLTFHVSNIKFNILGSHFLEKYVYSIKCSSQKFEIKYNNDIKSLKLYDSSIKTPPYYSRLFPVMEDQSIYFTPSEYRILTYSSTAYGCKYKNANGTILYTSDFSFIPLRKNMFSSIMDMKILEYPYQSFIQILILNPLNHPLTFVKGIIGYAQQDVSLNGYHPTRYHINELTELMEAYTLSYLTQGTSETLKKLYCLILSKQQERK